MPKSGSSEPEGQLAERNLRNGRWKNQPAEGNPESVRAEKWKR